MKSASLVLAVVQIKNFTSPDGLAGLSQATVVLAMVGNGLMVPRALLTRDKVWLAGSAWASFTGWAQLLSLFINHSPTGWAYTYQYPSRISYAVAFESLSFPVTLCCPCAG